MTVCDMDSRGDYTFMWGRWHCSLPPGHDGPHRAYVDHKVTGKGADVTWLGPWKDGTDWEGDEADRLEAEWLASR